MRLIKAAKASPYAKFYNLRLVWTKLVCSPRLPTLTTLEIFLSLGLSPFSLAKLKSHANSGPGL